MVLFLKEQAVGDTYAWLQTVRTAAQIITALFLWFNALKFLRPFKAYGHLIRMIGEVFADMAYFMLVFFVLIIAFSDAFYSESNSIA